MLEQLLNISAWASYSIAAVEKLLFFPYFGVIILKKQIPCWQGTLVTETPDHKLKSSLSRERAFLNPTVHRATRKLAPRQYYLRIRKPQLQKSHHLSGPSCTICPLVSSGIIVKDTSESQHDAGWKGPQGISDTILHSLEAGLTSALNWASQGVQMSFISQAGNPATPLSNLVSVFHHIHCDFFVWYLIRISLDAIAISTAPLKKSKNLDTP